MASLNTIKKDYNELLLELNPEDIEVLFKKINKKITDSLGSSKNYFKWNLEEIEKGTTELNELENTLKRKYPNISGLTASTRLETLLEKYVELEEETKQLIFKVHLVNIYSIASSLESNIDFLEDILNKFYFRYSFRIWNLESLLLEELNVPEDIVLDTLEPYIYGNSAFYNKAFETDYNSFIEAIVVNIESDIAKVKPYIETNVNPNLFIEEAVVKTVEGIVKFKSLIEDLIKRYENLKVNPFEVAIDVEAEVIAENYNELLKKAKYSFEETTVEKEKEKILVKAPSYNFDTFELIVPEGVN